MNKILKAFLFVVVSFVFSSCEGVDRWTQSQMSVLDVEPALSLRDEDGEFLEWQANTSYPVRVRYNTNNQEAVLQYQGRNFSFENAQLDEASGLLWSLPEESGQVTLDGVALGFEVSERCGDRCQSEFVVTDWEPCQYYDYRPVEVCYPRPSGPPYCVIEYRYVVVNGQREVTIRTITQHKQYFSKIFNEEEVLARSTEERSNSYTERRVSRCY